MELRGYGKRSTIESVRGLDKNTHIGGVFVGMSFPASSLGEPLAHGQLVGQVVRPGCLAAASGQWRAEGALTAGASSVRLLVNERAATQATRLGAASGEFGSLHLEHRGEMLADARGRGAAVRHTVPAGLFSAARPSRSSR